MSDRDARRISFGNETGQPGARETAMRKSMNRKLAVNKLAVNKTGNIQVAEHLGVFRETVFKTKPRRV